MITALPFQKCFFPQNLRSFSYKAGLPRFHAFHPYVKGHDGSDNTNERYLYI